MSMSAIISIALACGAMRYPCSYVSARLVVHVCPFNVSLGLSMVLGSALLMTAATCTCPVKHSKDKISCIDDHSALAQST